MEGQAQNGVEGGNWPEVQSSEALEGLGWEWCTKAQITQEENEILLIDWKHTSKPILYCWHWGHMSKTGGQSKKACSPCLCEGNNWLSLPWWGQSNNKVDKRTAWRYLCWVLRKFGQFTIFVFHNGISWNCKRQHLWKLLWKIKQHFHKSAGIATRKSVSLDMWTDRMELKNNRVE